MNIGILSGKGGTGKTTISTNLAALMNASYIDCDVEEPNGFIFLKPKDIQTKEVKIEYPFIDDTKCTMCGKCVEACQFNALAKVKEDMILFDKLCHSCGACKIVCEFDALTYKKRTIGVVEEGISSNILCKRGLLNIGEPMAVPIIKKLLKDLKGENNVNIVDCPPGTSCNVVSALQYVDATILVTEPTEFGLHDLKMAVELVRKFNIPMTVVINKQINEDNIIKNYCDGENISILGYLPYSKNIAEEYSKGKMLIDKEEYKKLFQDMVRKAKEESIWKL